MVFHLIAIPVTHAVALVAGGYLGYRYGRKVESKAQAAYAAAQAKVEAVKAAVK